MIADCMDSLGSALETIPGLRVFPYYADRVTPPAAVIGFPDSYDFDTTMRRGSDTIVFPITIVVGKADTRTARDALSAYCDGSGVSSVKVAIDSYASASYDSATVSSAEFGVVTIAATEYLAAIFDVVVTG